MSEPAVPSTEALHVKLDTSEPDPRFLEELDTMAWLLDQVRQGERLPVVEAEAIAHSVFVAMRTEGKTSLPMLPLHDMKQYGAVHGLNTAILSMGLGEFNGLDEVSVRAVGLAGLLHDIGMVRVPVELLAKAEQLEPEERELVRMHPAAGACIIVEAEASLELAAVVAYEHHLRSDGGGYPALSYPRAPHQISRLVQVCDTYHALRSPRPFREPWPADIVFSFMNQRAGVEFDSDCVANLTAMIKTWGST